MPEMEQYIDQAKKTLMYKEYQLWRNSFIFSIFLFIILSFYTYLNWNNYNLFIANKTFADTAMFLIGISFMFSGLGHFFNYNKYFVYRKYIGIMGFFYAFMHGIISLFLLPKIFPFPTYYLRSNNIIPFLFAFFSLVILLMMAIISNKYFIKKLGGQTWRILLRTGYIAFVFAIIHFGLKKYNSWFAWLSNMNRLPPLNFIVVFFGIFVIGLRIALHISLIINPNKPIQP